jgi:hypothetical protein
MIYMIYFLNMVIFHSYVELLEAISLPHIGINAFNHEHRNEYEIGRNKFRGTIMERWSSLVLGHTINFL